MDSNHSLSFGFCLTLIKSNLVERTSNNIEVKIGSGRSSYGLQILSECGIMQ